MQDETVQFHLARCLRPILLFAALTVADLTGDEGLATRARAEGSTSFATALGITSADGAVHTQAGVRLSLAAPAQLSERHIDAARASLQARMVAVRRCFADAMQRAAGVGGTVVVELTTQARGRVQAKTKQDASGDARMAECMRASLSRAVLRGVPSGTKVDAALEINNPVAALQAKQAQRSTLEGVRIVPGGLAESTGGTQANEVGYRVKGAAVAKHSIGAINQQFQDNLAGLLDCRRKASRRTRPAEGSLSLDVSIESGRVARIRPRASSMNDRRAQGCISAWLQRVDASQIAAAQLDVTVSFAR